MGGRGRARGGQYHQPNFQDPSGMRYGETQRSHSENQRRNPYGWDRAYPSSNASTSSSGWNIDDSAGMKESDWERKQSGNTAMHRVGLDGSAHETKSEIQREMSGGTLRDWYFDTERRESSGESAMGSWESVGKPAESNIGRDPVGESARRDFGDASGRMERRAEIGEASGEGASGWGFDVLGAAERAGEQREGGVLGKRKKPPGEQDLERSDSGSGEKQMRLHADFESDGSTEKSRERRECSEAEPGGETAKGFLEKPAQEAGEGSQQRGGSEDGGKARGEQQKQKQKVHVASYPGLPLAAFVHSRVFPRLRKRLRGEAWVRGYGTCILIYCMYTCIMDPLSDCVCLGR